VGIEPDRGPEIALVTSHAPVHSAESYSGDSDVINQREAGTPWWWLVRPCTGTLWFSPGGRRRGDWYENSNA